MNTYPIKNSLAPAGKPSFTATRNRARSADTITFNYSKGIPSNGTDVHPQVTRHCFHDGESIVTASGQVDDDVAIIAPGINRLGGQEGSQRAFYEEGTPVPAGYYEVSVTHSNIADHPSGNVSVLTGSLGPCPEVTLLPDKNAEVSCDACGCGGSAGADGGEDASANSGNQRSLAPASLTHATLAPFASSSGGSGVVRRANERHMRFAFDFGSFRGMGNIPTGQLELVAFDYNADSMLTPASLSYKHPLASVLVPQGEHVAANEIFRVFDGASYTNYMVMGDGSRAFGVGATSKKSERVHFVSACSRESSVECALGDEGAAFVRLSLADGSALFYNLETNEFAARIAEDGSILHEDEKLSILRNPDGSIRQLWNYWDGLADIVPAAEGSGYTISLYLPSQIALPAAEGELFTFTGQPFKTFTISGEAEACTLCVRERDLSLPESMPDYITTWTHTESGWNLATGEGEDAITETRERIALAEPNSYQLITTRAQGGVVASCVSELFSSSPNGELCLSRTEGYGSTAAQTTSFEYDEAGRQVRRLAPDGGEYKTVYDAFGRVTVESVPWAGGRCRLTTTTYREASSVNADPARVVESCVHANGTLTTLRTDTYTYTDLAMEGGGKLRRVEVRSSAAGSSATQQSITETWHATGEEPLHARGRLRMTQAVNGVQTWYDYNATTAHGALYTVTQETRVNGQPIAGQSRRRVDYIAATGNPLRSEEYALLADGETWALLSGTTYSYDAQNRQIGSTADNGRSTSRTLTCTGDVLTETDENGVTTTYSYDSARRLLESIRAEVTDAATGATITPETITSYTYDAAGRTLTTRRDVGPLTTLESTEYDLLGRVTKQTDALGRITQTSYSADGLTTTVTTPTGATLITTRNTDGSVAQVSGSGQREFYYTYELSNNLLRESVKLADQSTLVSQTQQNGFGETVVETTAVPGGLVHERSTYNAKGQLTRRQREAGSGNNGNGSSDSSAQAMAPMLYEYDAFGNQAKQTLLLDATAADDVTKNRITLRASTVESLSDGIYAVTSTTRYTASGTPLTSTQKQLISRLSVSLENKVLSINERGLTTTHWTEYNAGTKRVQKETVPSSTITAEAVSVDGFVLSQSDHAGISTTQSRQYTASGMVLTQTGGRGNTTTLVTDKAGRTLTSTDATGATTITAYEAISDQPASITNAQGKTTCYRYDLRGRKVAEWGTASQPATFAYDDADRLTALSTFRAVEGDVTSDPAERTDGDSTQWAYDEASGLELTKTYADGSTIAKTYDAFGRLATETNARGIVKSLSYDAATGQLLGMSFSDNTTPAQSFAYNVQGQLTQVTDAAGRRSFAYNEYGELLSDSLSADGDTHTITEYIDALGRNFGFDYNMSGVLASIEQYSYGADGRLSAAAFTHGGAWHSFQYGYLAGSNLLQTLTMPNGMSLTQQYEPRRDLLTGMEYKRGTTSVVERFYSYDSLGRPLTRQQNRQGGSRSDSFTHNDRSELTAANLGNAAYSYAYDNIGNRKTAQENAEEVTSYEANALNQYTAVGAFVPEFDADGNQTKVQTSTGIWNVTYNAENRPIEFSRTNEDGTTTRVSCTYDHKGRRATKKVETIAAAATTTLHQRYLYRGYLQIACCDLMRSAHPCLWLITWDPSQPVAARPLAIQKDATWYVYGWDLTKNICEVFGSDGYIKSVYSYTPYGSVSAEGNVQQPLQWSSEFHDEELGLVYYNYRHYNPMDGRWVGRDPLSNVYKNLSAYAYNGNRTIHIIDYLGLKSKDKESEQDYVKQLIEQSAGRVRSNSLYFVFYLNTFWRAPWAYSSDNGYVSHVAPYTKKRRAIGFNPEGDGGIKLEKRTDVVLIMECRCGNIKEVNKHLAGLVGKLRYPVRDKDGGIVSCKKWEINETNCAAMSHNVLQIYYNFDERTKIKWDKFLNLWGEGPRPEEVRALLEKINCKPVYTRPNYSPQNIQKMFDKIQDFNKPII